MEESVKKFMALAPLLLPRLISEDGLMDAGEERGVFVLRFKLDEELPIVTVMDMLEDDMELSLLFYGRNQTGLGGCCCYFTSPTMRNMYVFKANADKRGDVHDLTVSIYDSIDVMEGQLEDELKRGKEEYNLVQSLDYKELIKRFGAY